ncbi:MAG: hypothetical protein ACR2RA_15485, partial [Geminicoccaceae bacterium]
GVINQAIKDPEALKKQVSDQIEALGDAPKNLKDKLKDVSRDDAENLLKDLTKGDGEGGGSPAGNLLKGIFKK